jgi:hypothetical protein
MHGLGDQNWWRILRLRRHGRRRLKHDRELVDQYVRGYQEQPETDEERRFAQSTLEIALAESPWETEGQP